MLNKWDGELEALRTEVSAIKKKLTPGETAAFASSFKDLLLCSLISDFKEGKIRLKVEQYGSGWTVRASG